jgi:hypothetical protein
MELQRMFDEKLCPVCGFALGFKPWDSGSPSDEICPCCGIQFGYDDHLPDVRELVYRDWRDRWVRSGSKWWSKRPAPPDFDPKTQLERLQKAG